MLILKDFFSKIRISHYYPLFNPFDANAPFLYPLKTSETCFQGAEKGCNGKEWVNASHQLQFMKSLTNRFKEKLKNYDLGPKIDPLPHFLGFQGEQKLASSLKHAYY